MWAPEVQIDSPPPKKGRRNKAGKSIDLNPFEASTRYYMSMTFDLEPYAFYHRAVPVKGKQF